MRFKRAVKHAVKRAFRLLPSDNPFFAEMFRRYVNHFDGENNSDLRTNGELHFMRHVLKDCHIVFDVGANIGQWAESALQANSEIELHCFEPSKQTFERLQAKLAKRARCNHFGLSSTSSEQPLYIFSESSELNSLYSRTGLERWGLSKPTTTERICLQTLDHYCQNNGVSTIDYLKLDVEGHEMEVLKGALGMLQEKKIKLIQFEHGGCSIDSRTLLKDYFEFLVPFGFKLHKVYPDHQRYVERYDQGLENFHYQNWIAALAGL